MSFVIDAIRKARVTASDAISDHVSLYLQIPDAINAKCLRKQFGASEIAPAQDRIHMAPCQPLHTENGCLIDSCGRKRVLKGVNVDGAMKLPATPPMASYDGNSSDRHNVFFDGDKVLFVGRPFPLEEAEQHFARIKSWGYNTIRYLVTWEAIEHEGPGKYDKDFIEYTVAILEIIHKVGGLYVFLECHQDAWSRFCGGSGAPMWTLYAAGLEPTRFDASELALLHNSERFSHAPHDPNHYTKMLWTTNYRRLALFTMFTLFFAGETYFPRLKLDGVNIQHYLQNCFFEALGYLWREVVTQLPAMVADGTIVGFELLNEPNSGLVGYSHLNKIPDSQHLRLDTTPTAYQSFVLGMGLPVEVSTFKITVTGPQLSGSHVVDPRGQRAWLLHLELRAVDEKYGWQRSGWLGQCIYLTAGIWLWDSCGWDKILEASQEARMQFTQHYCKLNRPHYFCDISPRFSFPAPDEKLPESIDVEFFINTFFVEFYIKHKYMVRKVCPEAYVMIQPPVLEIPPKLKNDARNIIDEKTMYCPHYYDGMSLMFKKWNSRYNVDTLGIMRGRYYNPVLGIVFGEKAIRNCIKRQFIEMVREGKEYLGNIPVLMSETGMPFDMDDKKSYEDGSYLMQTSALDALAVALEALGMHHTFWCYTSVNSHKWGDRWNNEDFSLWSPDDRNLQFREEEMPEASSKRCNLTPSLRLIRLLKESDGYQLVLKAKFNYKKKRMIENISKLALGERTEEELENDDLSMSMSMSTNKNGSSLISLSSDDLRYRHLQKCYPSPDGVRAPSAVIRPFMVASIGSVKHTEFELRHTKFSLTLTFGEKNEPGPTLIFVPKWHYPCLDYSDIYLSAGYVKYNERLEFVEWFHENPASEESLVIKNNSGRIEDVDTGSRRPSVVLE